MNNKLWLLSKDNTAPFILVALTYFIFLSTPFIFFLILKASPHTSSSVSLYEYKNTEDTKKVTKNIKEDDNSFVDAAGVGTAQLNEFDDTEGGSMPVEVVTKNVKNWKKDADSRGFIILTRLSIFSIIIAFGAIGSAVSLISRTRNDGSILNNITILEILSIQTIGGIFACILGLAFMGNLLSGAIFPNPSVFYRIIYIPSAFAKLLVWSFIAGFSERFVPNVLNNFIKKAEDTKG